MQLKLSLNIYRNLFLWNSFNFASRGGRHHLYFYFSEIFAFGLATTVFVSDEGPIVFSRISQHTILKNQMFLISQLSKGGYILAYKSSWSKLQLY